MAKTDTELTRGDPAESEAIRNRVAGIKTFGEAEAYAKDVATRARLAAAARDAAVPPPRRPRGRLAPSSAGANLSVRRATCYISAIMAHALSRRLVAEFFGTFWLVLGGCGSAVLAAAFPKLGIGFAGVALAFGLTVLTGAYAFGAISGAHFNPAVTVGLWVARRIPGRDVLPYIGVQVVGAVVAAAVLYAIAGGAPGFSTAGGFASNGYGDHSPGSYSLIACVVCELVMTFMFLMVILGATDTRAPGGFAPLAIGLALTLIHLISIPVTNTSVNPARSTGPALFVGGWVIAQLWMFWIVPLAGAALAGAIYPRAFGAMGTAPEKPALGGEGQSGI